MARLAVMSETMRRSERREDPRALSVEEREHSDHISENYRKLMFDNAEAWVSSAQPAAEKAPAATATLEHPSMRTEAYTPVREETPVYAPAEAQPAPSYTAEEASKNTAQRLADYVAYPAGKKKVLFENLLYKNGELIDTSAPAAPAAPAAEAVVMPAAPVYAPAMPAAPAQAPAEEDALPTRRTMDTLRHADATQEETRTNLLAALSLKTKLVLCAIAAAIVLAIVIVCINTGILSAANADILAKNAQLAELTESYTQVQNELEAITDPAFVDNWAQANGMVRPD